MEWQCGRYRLRLDERPLIMGILNVTPDSFSDGYPSFDAAIAQAERLVHEGAHIIDVGGESARPGAESIAVEDELARVIPVIEALRQRFDVPISIDTQKASVAREALRAGASIVNGVSATLDFREMAPVIAESDAGFVAMHMLDRPRRMQRNPSYDDVVGEVAEALAAVGAHLAELGVASERLVYDPGIGFGKVLKHNLVLLENTKGLAERLGRPLLIGVSRKSWLTHLLAVPRDAINELDTFTVLASIRLPFPAAAIHRVHNVRLLDRAFRLADRLRC